MADIGDEAGLDELPLSERAKNALRWSAILSAGQIRALTDKQLLRVPNIGLVTVRELRDVTGPFVPQRAPPSRSDDDSPKAASPLLRQTAMRIVGKEMAMMSPDDMRAVLGYALRLVDLLSGSEPA